MGRSHECAIQSRSLSAGDTVGSYVIDGLIAGGGMCNVYEATHRLLPRRVAIKVLRDDLQLTKAACDGLLQEAEILEQLAHPGIARIYEVGVLADGTPWIAMERVEGEPLADLLERRGQLGALEVAELMLEVLAPLGAAHERGVIHRDLKPENIMLVSDGKGARVRLIDWGIAHVIDRPLRNAIGAGTPHYMAPEQIRGERIDTRTDLYALGVVAYELLAGAPPFSGASPVEVAAAHLEQPVRRIDELRADVPQVLVDLIHVLLSKSPAGRPGLEELQEELQELVETVRAEAAGRVIELDYTVEEVPALREVPRPAQHAFTDIAPRSPQTRWTPNCDPHSIELARRNCQPTDASARRRNAGWFLPTTKIVPGA